MRLSRRIRTNLLIVAVSVGLALIFYNFILDWHGRPSCHSALGLSLKVWMADKGLDPNSNTNYFPNVRGLSMDSMLSMREEMNGTNWAQNYRYVPGLREDDPGQLVLFYVNQPTRWIWHAVPRTIFREKRWLIVPVDFAAPNRAIVAGGEHSERLTTEEFRQRLSETIEFVRTNQRTNWQTIVAEQTKFLGSVK
jgi:hypothetical protein